MFQKKEWINFLIISTIFKYSLAFGIEYVRPVSHEFNKIDNLKVLTETESMVLNNIYSRLVNLDENAELVGDLAYLWSIEDMGKVYRFKIKKNIKFHNGEVLELGDIKYSILKLKNKIGDTFFAFKDIMGVSVDKSQHEIVIKLKYANPDFLTYLADESSIILKRGQTSATLNGTGPFRFTSISRDKLILKKNGEYYAEKPKLDTLIFKNYQTKQQATSDYLIGKVDDLFHFNLKEIDRKKLKNKCNWKFELLATHRFLVLKSNHKLMKTKSARSCLLSLIHTQGVRERIAEGQPILNSLVAKGVFGDHLVKKESSYNCEKEDLEILQKNKKPFIILSVPPHRNSKILKEALLEVNVVTNIKKFASFRDYYSYSKTEKADLYFIRYTPRIPSIIFYTTLFFTPNPIISVGVEKNAKVVDLVSRISGLYDKKQRALIIAQLFKELDNEKIVFPLHQFEFLGCYQKKWQGVVFPATNYYMQDFTKLRLKDDK